MAKRIATALKNHNLEYTPIVADAITYDIIWRGRTVDTKAEALKIAEAKLDRWEMDRFCFGVITGLALALIVEPGWPIWSKAVVIVPLYLIGRYFAYKLSNS